jgi:prophage tail gpP-like protein
MSEGVTIDIDGRRWAYWSDLEVHLGLDSHGSVGFTAPFEAERRDFRDTFRPYSFKPLVLSVDGEPLFTGTLVDVNPTVDPGEKRVSCSAYSRPAVLEESNLPASSAPFEASGLSLRQIAQRLCAPFGIDVVVEVADGSPFKKVSSRNKKGDTEAEPDQRIQAFLVDLAKQRGLVVSSTSKGELLFRRAVAPGSPVGRLEEGVPPLVSVVPTFNPSSYYSEITGFSAAKRGRVGAKYTERLQRLSGGWLRSHNFKLEDTEKADAPAAVRAKVSRMYAEMATYVINVPTWRDTKGRLWQPNTTLVLKAPGSMIYDDYEFLIRDVYLKQSAGETTASLGLVLPGAFVDSTQIKRFPWEEP